MFAAPPTGPTRWYIHARRSSASETDGNRCGQVGTRQIANGGPFQCHTLSWTRSQQSGVHFEKFSTAGWYLTPGTCLAQQTSWTTVSGQLPKQATCDWDPSSGFCSFRLCVFLSVTYYLAGFEPPPPSRSPRQSVFFPPSQCFCFRRWQTAPPVQFNTYYTLQITLSHTEAGGGGKKKGWWRELGRLKCDSGEEGAD